MTKFEAIKLITKTYKFETPVPSDVQRHMLKIKKNILINIFRKYGRYSFLIMLAVSLFFWLKKIGMGITAVKAWFAISVFTVTAVGAITAGTIATVKHFYDLNTKLNTPEIQNKSEENIIPAHSIQNVKPLENDKAKQTEKAIQYKATLIPFTYNSEIYSLGTKFQSSFYDSLRKLKGTSAITLSGAQKEMTPLVLSGSIIKLGTSYLINIKLINNSNSEVIQIITKKTNSEEETIQAASDIAQQISSRL